MITDFGQIVSRYLCNGFILQERIDCKGNQVDLTVKFADKMPVRLKVLTGKSRLSLHPVKLEVVHHQGVWTHSLTSGRHLFDAGYELGKLPQEKYDECLEWLLDPFEYTKKQEKLGIKI